MPEFEAGNNVNNMRNNIVGTPRQLARRKPARGCEPSSLKLSSQLFRLFPVNLDKVLSVTDGDTTRTFTYHADGQLASATVGSALRADRGATPLSETETFLWDGLALIQRGDEQFMNEPHVGGGNPVASSNGTSYFNDALGTTVGAKRDGKYSAAALTAFGEDLTVDSPTPTQNSNFFTGKPYVEGLGHAFWMRNYRAGLAKWQTADPMGYPDGWNQLAYCGNGVMGAIDLWGSKEKDITTVWRYAESGGAVGYPMLDVFDYMKDSWENGIAIMRALGIKTVDDLCKKAQEQLSDDVKKKIQEMVDNGMWFDALMKAESNAGGASGYDSTEPSENSVMSAIPDAETILSITLIRIVPDIEIYRGQKFVCGCEFTWRVVYE